MSPAAMRILHVVDNLDRGGLERVVCDLSTEQLRRGYDVAVYCLHTPGSLATGLRARGVQVLCGHKRRGADLRVILQLKRLTQGRGRALLHAHSMMPNYYACAARLLGGMSVAVVNTRHDMGSTIAGDRREKLYRLSVPLTRLAVMVSQSVMDRFVDSGVVPARKARLVLNGIHTDCPLALDPVQRAAARRLINLADDQFVVGCVGRLVQLKNHAAAIRAVARVMPVLPQLRLVLIGGGPLRDKLAMLASELGIAARVLLLGERNDTRELLPALDAFVMPSLTEGHSIALLEAMAAGLAIIATSVGGNAETVTHNRRGLLVPVNDDASIAAALTRLVCESGLKVRLGTEARQWAVEHVSVHSMADSYEAIYAEALGLPVSAGY
jgi:glycosyltransferase involved in cell wall biosynthesis